MKKITALLLALLLALSLCTMGAAADETVTIVLEPADDTLLTAEGLALFFVDRAAVKEETETSVSWYKETAKDGKTERELIAEMPLIIKITAVGPRIFVADGYEPSKELIDLVKNHAPEKDADSEHTYGWHRIFNQNCRWRGLRYGTCKDCFGIEFDLCQGNHSYKDGSCTVCGRSKPGEEPEHVHSFTPWTALDDGMHHGRVPAVIRKWASTTWKRKGFSTPTKLSLLNAALFADLNTVVKWRKYALHISVPGFPGTDFLCVYIRGGVW